MRVLWLSLAFVSVVGSTAVYAEEIGEVVVVEGEEEPPMEELEESLGRVARDKFVDFLRE